MITKQRIEAIKRMKILNLHKNAIKDFELDNLVNVSEHYGALYWADETQKEYIKQFEQKYDALVYHCIKNYTEFGELLSFLYVSAYEEEWDYDIEDLMSGHSCVYVKNLDDEICSEFGSISIESSFGGLIRTA